MLAFRDTPVTYILTYAVAGMAVWLGAVMLTNTVHLPAERLKVYAGPMSLMGIQAWGWWFVVGGLTGLARPLFHEARKISLGLHLVNMTALLAWALAFDFGGPPSTGQPAYTFLAIVAFLSPWMPVMIQRRYGERPPLPGQTEAPPHIGF